MKNLCDAATKGVQLLHYVEEEAVALVDDVVAMATIEESESKRDNKLFSKKVDENEDFLGAWMRFI